MLEEATAQKKMTRRHRDRIYDYARIPAAVEVNEQWLAFEDKLANHASLKEFPNTEDADMQHEESDDNMVLDVKNTTKLIEWYALSRFADKGINPCLHR
jgi:hypothetical protein